jgi:hypothetical protein
MLDTLQRASFHVLQITLFLLMVSALAGAGGIMDLSQANSESFTDALLPVIAVINFLLLLLFMYCFYLECKRFALHVLGRGRDEDLTWGDLKRLPKSFLASAKSNAEAAAAGRAAKQQQQMGGGVQDPHAQPDGVRGPSKV